MAPTTSVNASQPRIRATRHRRSQDPRQLDQLPAWSEFVPVARPPGQDDLPPGQSALVDGLDRDQLRAVTHGTGPLLVVAGAGTGKTEVITRRIAWLIGTRQAKPSEILALTFTDKAASEMAVRVDQLVPYGFTDTAISTFHAFGDRIIRDHALELGLPSDVRVLSRAEVVIFLREHLFDLDLDIYRPLGDPTRFLSALAALFSRCKDEDISPTDYLAHADRVATEARQLAEAVEGAEPMQPEVPDATAIEAAAEEARRQTELARAFDTYQALLAANGFIDFGDQVALALRLVRSSAAARAEIAGRYRYILVDEFQDTNRAQAELVAALAEGHDNVTVVGDDDQAIYAFRGAALDNILAFSDRYPGGRTVVLRRNYRSRPPILDAAYRLIRFNDPVRLEVRTGVSKRLRAERHRPDPRAVELQVFGSGAEEADWIAAEIGRRRADGAAFRDHAILLRANQHADPVTRALNMAGVPWRFSGTSGLYARPEVRLLLSFLRAIADLDSSVDLYALCASEVYGLGGEDLTEIMNLARRRNRSLWATLLELERQPGILRIGPASRLTVSKVIAAMRAYSAAAHGSPAGVLLYRFLRESGLLRGLVEADAPGAEERLQNIARFFEIVRSQSSLLTDDRAVFVVPHLLTLIEAGDDPATAEPDPDSDAVAILTVHKAKGLEFPVVFLPGMVDGRFPSHGRAEPLRLPVGLSRGDPATADGGLAEERRLCYVAMTRARDELVVSYAADYGGARARRVSPFVLEALDLAADGHSPGRGARRSPPEERLAMFETKPPIAREPSGPITDPLTLSYYQIDDYLICPLKYRYAHVLRIPLAPHHAIVYGAALHRAVQVFHQRHAKGHVMSEDELDEVFESAWSNEGFISREHEDARRTAGRAALRRFRADQLRPEAVIPTYVEREFTFTLGGDRVRGRWDRVDVVPLDHGAASGAAVSGTVDVASPSLDILGPERVTITDYKSSDVRDPDKARKRARESLQLQIYAMGYEAMTGRLPDRLALHFLGSGLVGEVAVDPKRLTRARDKIVRSAAGIRARDYTPTPGYVACSFCAFRDICPTSVAR